MKLEYEDLELLALFTAALGENSSEVEKAFDSAVAMAELSDYQKSQLSDFLSKWVLDSSTANNELVSRFQVSSWKYENDRVRARTVLWDIASIGFGNKSALEFAQSFASYAKIDRSVLLEFTDILQTKSALRSSRSWANEELGVDEADRITAQCGADWEILKRSIGDLIDLG